MRPGRRKVLVGLAVGIAAAAAIGFGWRPLAGRWRERIFRLPDDVAPAPVDVGTLAALLAAVDALLNTPIERQHYADLFSWRAENVTGHLGAYRRIVRMLDAAAIGSHGRPYAELPIALRRSQLARLRVARGNKLRTLWVSLSKRERLLLERHFVEPVLELYTDTDALIAVGYEAWPGMPRGLDSYLRAPRGAGQFPIGASVRSGT